MSYSLFKNSYGNKLELYLSQMLELAETELRTIKNNSLPSQMDAEHLKARADFLGILHFENDTEESFRDRVASAYFWWFSAGTTGQFRRTLSLIMKGEQKVAWDYLSGRETIFEIGLAEIGNTQIGYEGYFDIRLLKPSESQVRDVYQYCNWAIAPYLEYKIISVDSLEALLVEPQRKENTSDEES